MKITTFAGLKAGAAPLVLGVALISAPAFAQDTASQSTTTDQENGVSVSTTETEGQEIVVTGSRIVRRDLDSAAPIAVVSDEEFKLSGAVNVENVVNTLPQVVPGATAFSNNPGGGVATLNLRGLGSARTLVLVNGRRYMFYDTAQVVDLNTIPSFLIDGVDVVTGGASAVYGSDALSGVVNFRLRTDLNGAEVGAQYNITEEGDGARYNAYIALGSDFADGNGHATVFAEYYNRKPIFQGARSFSAEALGEDDFPPTQLVPGGSSTTPNGRVTFTGANCPTGNVFCGGGAFFTGGGNARPRVSTDLYNFAPVNYLQVPQERYLMGGYANYDFGDGHTVYAEATFVNNRVANELAPTPVTGTYTVNIAAVDQFLAPDVLADLTALDALDATPGDGNVRLAIQRRITETGGRNALDERNAFRVLAGVKGPIAGNFGYDVYYSYARTRNAQIQRGNISRSGFQAGLDGTGTPLNIFGPGTLDAAALEPISILAQNGEVSVLQVASGAISGTFGNLGWGGDDLGLAFGVEYRKVASEFIPDTALSSGDVIGFNAGDPTAGSYNVKEVFGEVRIPIAGDQPFFHKLELTGAARYSDYSLEAVGGVWTYAGGIEWAPVRDLTLRGQYQRAIRAPNVAELFGGQSVGFPAATDPCAVPSAATNATIRALCIATGVPADRVGTAFIQLNPQIQGLFGGNPDLQEETSDSYTFGAVLRPSFIPGLAITADYYNIKIKDAISTLGGGLGNSLNLCYNVIQDINSVYCQAFVGARNELGQFDGEVPPAILNANVGALKTSGIDLQVDYSLEAPFSLLTDTQSSRLNFFFLGTWTEKFDITPVQALPDQVNECAGRFGTLACGTPTPKYKWTSRLSLIDGPMTASFRWRHTGAVRDDDADTPYFVERIGAYDLFDLSFAFDLTDNFSLAAGVNNLFDKKPTILGFNQEQANTYPGVYDVLGRDYFVSAKLIF